MNVFQFRDLVIEISKYLKYQDLIRFRSVNKVLYLHSKDDRYITLICEVRCKGSSLDLLIDLARSVECSAYGLINCIQCGIRIIYCKDTLGHFFPRSRFICTKCGEIVCRSCSYSSYIDAPVICTLKCCLKTHKI